MSENINREIYTELANRIYDLDAEVYRVLGSSLGRTFTGNRDTTIRTLSMLMYTKPDGHLLRSELALVSNMATKLVWFYGYSGCRESSTESGCQKRENLRK